MTDTLMSRLGATPEPWRMGDRDHEIPYQIHKGADRIALVPNLPDARLIVALPEFCALYDAVAAGESSQIDDAMDAIEARLAAVEPAP